MQRIYLSPPSLSGDEHEALRRAINSGWVAPMGPELDLFEQEIATIAEVPHAVGLSSGTAALHLSLILCGVEEGDEVVCPTLTFVATANAICYCGARPVFIDSEPVSWNLDPDLLEEFLTHRAALGKLPKAVIAVDLYGQTADYDRIVPLCHRFGVRLVEDAAEALGATHNTAAPGSFGTLGVFSFNGNKIITTSGGGMLVSKDRQLVERARHLATQARMEAPHYEHQEVGYNYRLSNLLAALGRSQLATLTARVHRRRARFEAYVAALQDESRVGFMPEAPWGQGNRWLSVMTLEPQTGAPSPEALRKALEHVQIEARPVWKPMHLQPAFKGCEVVGGAISEHLFATGLCLPSGDNLTAEAFDLCVSVVQDTLNNGH